MIWKPPSLKILTLSCDQPTHQVSIPGDLNTFRATGTGFDEASSQLLFVRADVIEGTLKPFQIIPCRNVKVSEAKNIQTITFEASLFQREVGPYHLIGWNPTDDEGINQSTVLEWAMAVREEGDPSLVDE